MSDLANRIITTGLWHDLAAILGSERPDEDAIMRRHYEAQQAAIKRIVAKRRARREKQERKECP